MVSFWIYDVGFLVLFSIWVAWFLRSRKKALGREGIIFMYRTQLGVNAIKYVGDHFKKTLHFLKYIIITVGFGLMASMLWMLWTSLSIYIMEPAITQVIKAPPIAPLIPYFPKLFGMQSFFPPFYFTYFIVALAIVAIVHEFSHGIFMRLFKVKIKSTGLVFLGPILGAFVEQDDNSFKKKAKLEQMTVLGAGVFANIVFALIFYGLYVAFFFVSFSPAGYAFNTYADVAVPVSDITQMVEGEGNLTRVTTVNGKDYYASTIVFDQINLSEVDYIVAYEDAPAVKVRMKGAIVQMNDAKIRNEGDITAFMQSTEPGDEVKVITIDEDGTAEYNVVLGEHPISEIGYLGIGYGKRDPKGFLQNSLVFFMSFKDMSTYYAPNWDGEFVYFFYHLLWWVMIINLLVALFNMLPVGMLDGGRFFYLTILGITRSKKTAKIVSRFMAYAILMAFVLMMFFWLIRIV